MKKNWIQFFSLLTVTALTVTGCATARPRKPDANSELSSQVAALQNELQAKDQQIQDLQYQLEQNRSLPQTNFSGSKSSLIRVSGVSVSDVQRALNKAGFDAGSVDGKFGKKTKQAIKAFQRAHNLSADGVVGEKTWSLLNS